MSKSHEKERMGEKGGGTSDYSLRVKTAWFADILQGGFGRITAVCKTDEVPQRILMCHC